MVLVDVFGTRHFCVAIGYALFFPSFPNAISDRMHSLNGCNGNVISENVGCPVR